MDSKNITEMCESLMKWFEVLNTTNTTSKQNSREDLSNGVAMAQALHQIAPDSFTDTWLAKIKGEVGNNWRLKVSNLKKVTTSVMDYYVDVLNLTLTDFPVPDVHKIAEKNDPFELGRLLQLILGCAVNCAQKQDYITQIMELEESLQRNIMKAIQELEGIWLGGLGGSSSRTSLTISSSKPPTANLSSSAIGRSGGVDERDALAQRCYEAERRAALLLDEKFSLQQELNKMQETMDKMQFGSGVIDDDGKSLGPAQPGSTRYTELRRHLDQLKDELLVSETQRDDFKMKSTQQEKEIVLLQIKVDDLHKTFEELALVKDEVDALRESSERLKQCEAQLVTYKKKFEDYNDLRRQVKMLEERCADYLQQNVQHEENIKKHSTLKSQVELYKKEIEELHYKLDAEIMKSVKIEFDLSNSNAKLTAIQREKDNLQIERDTLQEQNDELRCNSGQIKDGGAANAMSRELLSPTIRERLDRLEAENRALREGQGDQTVLAQFMDDSNQRMEKLRDQLKEANQKILILQSENEQSVKGNGDKLKATIEMNERKAVQIDEVYTQLAQHQSKISQLEAALTAREQELQASDIRYRKCLEKAKEVIKSLDPKSLLAVENMLIEKNAPAVGTGSGVGGGGGGGGNGGIGYISTGNVNSNDQTDPLDVVRPPIGPVEEQLMATAYYRMSMACHRDAMEARLALLNGAGQSFLNRQRQPAARKPHTANTSYKK